MNKNHITIQSIELTNFMCHSHLKINFEKMITCIGGRNGSGKSAVMAALGIVFGQRAKELDRGNSYKNLIKTGTNCATIRIKINNHRNYKREKYGDFILIEKKLKDSTTKFSIFNFLGKIFNLKKDELEMIVETYNLRFDNPLNFLTQEGSKKFLNMSSPKSLYDFYYVGTEFKNLDEDLQQSRVYLKDLEKNIEIANEQLSLIEVELGTYYSELKYLEYDPEATLKNLENEENWLNISNDENKVKKLEEERICLQKQINELEKSRLDLHKILEKVFTEQSTKDEEEEKDRLILGNHGLNKEIEEYESDKLSIELNIKQIKSKSNIEELSEYLKGIQETIVRKKRELSDLEALKEESYLNMQAEKEDNSAKKEKLSNFKKQLDYLKQNAYDPNKNKEIENVNKIRQEMKKYTFKDSIIGPLYEFISLKNTKWYKVVSILFKHSLNNFIVFNRYDKAKLLSIFNNLQLDYTVSQMKSKKAYKYLQSNPNFLKIIDILDIRNEVVSNYLITTYSIEQLILMDDRSSAHKIIQNDPKNVDCAYTPTGDKIKLQNGSLTDFRARDDGYYWFEDKSSKIKKFETEMESIRISDGCLKEYNRVIHGIGSLTSEIESLEKKATRLTLELDSYSNLKENDTGNLEKQYRILSKSIESLSIKRDKNNSRIQELEKLILSLNKINRDEKEKLLREQEETRNQINQIDYQIMALVNKKEIKGTEIQNLQNLIASKIQNSNPKPETVRTISEIVKDRKIAYEYRQRIKEMSSKETLETKIAKLECKQSDLQNLKEKFEKSLEETNKIYEKRISKKEEIKAKNTREAIESFKEYTARSGYEGIMVIDHENRTLDLKMKVHNSKIAGSKSTLSGGERSFAGVCFLLSMWKCFKCPVKVLDEFDVFMDPLNRRNTIYSLLEFFKENQVQVILITPLDTKDLEDPDVDIKVLTKVQ